eukprot:6527796-Pyramimonas_sp.AAC.1
MAGNIGFLRKWRGRPATWANGNKLWCKSNDPIEKRLIDKTLGQVKYRLIENGTDQKTIRIYWETEVVK